MIDLSKSLKKKMKKVSVCGFVLLLSIISRAQNCEYFPADCPETGDIEAAQDSDVRITNLIIPQEITMQNNLRVQIITMMKQIAEKNNWGFYQYTEAAGGGVGAEGVPTPYALRRPYQFMISFDFIVNKDSLNAWKNWYNNDLQNAANKVVESYKQSGVQLSQDQNQQNYLDSANYYGDQKNKYMTDHIAEYQKALLSGDKKGQKKYEDEMKKYDDKINVFINNTNDKTSQGFSESKSQGKDLGEYKHKNTIAFRNGSIIRVSLNINDYIAFADDDDGNKKITKQFSLPGITQGLFMHNSSPRENEVFGQYLRSPDVAMLLFGKWLLKLDQYHSYHSMYFADKKNTDAVTVKKIPCDKIQTIVLHVEGGIKYINQFLQSLNTQQISDLVVK